jgi:alpha-glucosidase (family GH31 glycosyl hydrolase)
VTPNQRARDIYLPPGQWRDYWTKQIFTGATVLKDYPAPLEVLPLFERVGE